MTIIPLRNNQRNREAVVRQEWRLARKHYEETCRSLDARDPDHIRRFRDAHDRRTEAFERYMLAMIDSN